MTTHTQAAELLRKALSEILRKSMESNIAHIAKDALAATASLEAPSGEVVAWLLCDQGCRAPDDCEDYLRVELPIDLSADELARFVKAGRATPLFDHPPASTEPATIEKSLSQKMADAGYKRRPTRIAAEDHQYAEPATIAARAREGAVVEPSLLCPTCNVDRAKGRCKAEHWQKCPMVATAYAAPRPATQEAAEPAQHLDVTPPVAAYICPAGCGCMWRDNRDGTMSLFDGEQKSCAVCEPLPLAALEPMAIADHLFIDQREDGIWVVCVEKIHRSEDAARLACRRWKKVYRKASPATQEAMQRDDLESAGIVAEAREARAISLMHQSTGIRCPKCFALKGERHAAGCEQTGVV